MRLLQDKNRDYRRWSHSMEQRMYLAQQGLRAVQSSNVSAVGVHRNDLIIRFHNGSLYQYKDQAKRVDDIFASNSKGRWVWNELRRKGIPYKKIGTLPLETDLEIDDMKLIEVGSRLNSTYDLSIRDITQLAQINTIGVDDLFMSAMILGL